MGSDNQYETTTPTSTPTPVTPPVNKYPNVPVKDNSVDFYAEVSGIRGNFVSRFSLSHKDGKAVLENISFQDQPITIERAAFHGTQSPILLQAGLYLNLDDYRKGKTTPLSDITGALGL